MKNKFFDVEEFDFEVEKQRFIAVINKPVKPEDQYNYWRHRGFLTSILIVIISFLLIKFLISVSDNRDI